MSFKAFVIIVTAWGTTMMFSDTKGTYASEDDCKARVMEMSEFVKAQGLATKFRGWCKAVEEINI